MDRRPRIQTVGPLHAAFARQATAQPEEPRPFPTVALGRSRIAEPALTNPSPVLSPRSEK